MSNCAALLQVPMVRLGAHVTEFKKKTGIFNLISQLISNTKI